MNPLAKARDIQLVWVEIAARVPGEWVEAVSYYFRELGAGGVAIYDSSPLQNVHPEERPGGWKQQPGEPVTVTAYFTRQEKEEKLRALEAFLDKAGIAFISLEAREVRDEDWLYAWKKYYHTHKVGNCLVIKPAWEDYRPGQGELVIEIDPGMAFGTGTHPTTAMCLEILEKQVKPGDTVLDVGTGSGILAIAAARLGAAKVLAVDNDPLAVRIAKENVSLNGLDTRVEVREGDLLSNVSGTYGLIVANILTSVIKELVPQAVKVMDASGRFIASGVIRDRYPEVREAVDGAGLEIKELAERGEWVALLARRR